MVYLKRKIDSYLYNWFNDKSKKPLIVKGARQIGKTESIRRFASSHYSNFVEINFVENLNLKQLLRTATARKILSKILPG